MSPSFCIVIPSAARTEVDYLAGTVDDLAAKLQGEAEQIEAIIVYNPSAVSKCTHRGFAAVERKLAEGGYGRLGDKLRLVSPDDLPDRLQRRHAITREPRNVRQCNDYAHTLFFARETRADFVLLLEDDVRLARAFFAKAAAVDQDAENQGLSPLFISLFSPVWGPPERFFRYFGYSQAILARSGEGLDAIRVGLACDQSEHLADVALAKIRVGRRSGLVRYPSLVQHVGTVSVAVAGRRSNPVSPTFYEHPPPPAFGLRCRLGWMLDAIRRRLSPQPDD